MGINLYQSDPRSMPHDELLRLSEELYAEYRGWGGDDEHWTDDAAAERYYALTAEISRRWYVAHPDKVRTVQSAGQLARAALSALAETFTVSRALRDFEPRFKTGDTIQAPKPPRFQQ